MTDKKIEPTNPAVSTTDAKSAEAAERKTSGASGRFRKLAAFRGGRTSGRKSNSFRGA